MSHKASDPSPTGTPAGDLAQKRRRSRLGCLICRKRKKACDNVRPVCGSCTRLNLPCQFPKLYRNEKGELVPSPQPNGRTRKRPRGESLPPLDDDTPLGESSLVPIGPHTDPNRGPPSVPHDHATTSTSGGDWEPRSRTTPATAPWPLPNVDGQNHPYHTEEDAFAESALDDFLASLGDAEGGQGWAWPFLTDAAGLDLDINGAGGGAGIQGGPQSNTGAHQGSAVTGSPSSAVDSNGLYSSNSNKMITAAAVLEHLPTLYDYFVNSFSPVLSVLGGPGGNNPVLEQMLPVVQRSPLVMCALIAWAANHRAVTGHPYGDVARVATETVELQIDAVDIERELSMEEREEYMWTLVIIGGIEIVRGDLHGWVRRLPMTRRLLDKALQNVDFKNSPMWQSLAYNCAYHDILVNIATTRHPRFPPLYERILNLPNMGLDGYMGATGRIFLLLTEIATLAAEVSGIILLPASDDRDRQLGDLIAQHVSILDRLRNVEIPLSVFSQPLAPGTDRSHLIVAIQTFRAAAELYLRQVVLRSASSDLQCQILAKRIMHNLRLVLGTNHESQMMFPLFLAGVSTVSDAQRREILGIWNKFSERTQIQSINQIVTVQLEVWKRNPDGNTYVDWRKLVEDSGVVISFA